MQTAVAIDVKDYWGDTKNIKDADIQINVNRNGEPFYRIMGINGTANFVLLMTYDKGQAVNTYNQIKTEILEQQFDEIKQKYS